LINKIVERWGSKSVESNYISFLILDSWNVSIKIFLFLIIFRQPKFLMWFKLKKLSYLINTKTLPYQYFCMFDDSAIVQLLGRLVDIGINGYAFLPSASKVAEQHLRACHNHKEDAINSIIVWSTAYASGTGFVTGLGSWVTLPLAIPTSLASSYALGANTAAAIAYLRGYDLNCDLVRTFILLALIGDSGVEILKTVGINLGTKATKTLISQIPCKVFIEINKKVGFKLITKAEEKGVINMMKIAPLVGGLIGAGFDGTFVNQCGQAAQNIFTPI
jgi:hypothetical protein